VRILHRYILKEMLKALALSAAAVSGVLCFAMVLSALQKHGLGLGTSLLYMALSVPGAMYIALPLSAVLAGTLVYGRLASDNEVMACRASGIPPSSLFWPSIVLALMAAGITLALASWPLSESNYAAKQLALADMERLFFGKLTTSGRIRIKQANFEITVDRVEGNMLHGPALKYRDPKRGQLYCYAPWGEVQFDHPRNQAILTLWGSVVVDEAQKVPVRGDAHTVRLDLPTNIPRSEDDMSLWMLLALDRDPGRDERVLAMPPETPEAAVQAKMKDIRARVVSEMHGRLATALACFGLVLIGAGLGMYFHSGHLLTAFGVALAPWLASTLLTMLFVKTVIKAAGSNPEDKVWLIWAPNVVAVVLGLAVLACVSWLWSSPVSLGSRIRGALTWPGRSLTGAARRGERGG